MVQHAAAEDEGIAGSRTGRSRSLWDGARDLGLGEGGERQQVVRSPPANSMPGASAPQGVRAIQQVSIAQQAPSARRAEEVEAEAPS
jgi:hypothetical protein